jgi:hypothetical protein
MAEQAKPYKDSRALFDTMHSLMSAQLSHQHEASKVQQERQSGITRIMPTCKSAQAAAAEEVPRKDSRMASGPLASSSLVSCVASRMTLMLMRPSSRSAAPTSGSRGTSPCTLK